MGKVISKESAGPDHPIYKEEGLQSYSPSWAHGYLKSKKTEHKLTNTSELVRELNNMVYGGQRDT